MNLISIITVNFNQREATIQLLNSISRYYPNANIEVILVDNGSKTDYCSEFINACPDLIYIRSNENLGFAGGNNLGVRKAKGELLFFVNNDTEFTAGLLEILSQTIENNRHIGVVSPQINYFEDQRIVQYAGFTEMNYYTCRNRCIGQFEVDTGQFRHFSGPTGYAHGAAMMVSRRAIEDAGLMPEHFFLYYEEMDWCDRIMRAGYEIWVNTGALIYHKESLSVGKNSALKEYFMNRNRILFIRRNASYWQRTVFCFYFAFIVTPRNIFRYLSTQNAQFVVVLLQAIRWNLTHNTHSDDLGIKLN